MLLLLLPSKKKDRALNAFSLCVKKGWDAGHGRVVVVVDCNGGMQERRNGQVRKRVCATE